jgi:hypothetical protein
LLPLPLHAIPVHWPVSFQALSVTGPMSIRFPNGKDVRIEPYEGYRIVSRDESPERMKE